MKGGIELKFVDVLENLPTDNYRDVRGHILRLPHGVIGVPIEYKKEGWWRVLVIGGTNDQYPQGGHDIIVPHTAIDESERILVS